MLHSTHPPCPPFQDRFRATIAPQVSDRAQTGRGDNRNASHVCSTCESRCPRTFTWQGMWYRCPHRSNEAQEKTMSQHFHRHPNLFVAAALTGGLLVGCNPPLAPAPPVTTPTSMTASEPPSPSPSPTLAPSPARKPIQIPGAHPGAGGPRPDNATPVTAVHQDVATIINPAENIGCDFSEQHSYVGCGIDNYVTDMPYGRDQAGPKWWVEMSTSDSPGLEEPTITSKNRAPAFQRSETPPQVVPYGTVVYHGDYTCASELAGMTCWNTTTGHGAFMSSMNTTTF